MKIAFSSSLAIWQYSKEPKARKNLKGYGNLSFSRKYKNQLLDTGRDDVKDASKKLVCKVGESLGNTIADAVKID